MPAGQTVEVKSTSSENGEQDNHTIREYSDDVVAECAEAVQAVGLRLAGVDLVTPDIMRPLAEADGAVIEVNGTPGFQYHYEVEDRAGATRVAVPVLETLLQEAERMPAAGAGTQRALAGINFGEDAGRVGGHSQFQHPVSPAAGTGSTRLMSRFGSYIRTARPLFLREGSDWKVNRPSGLLRIPACGWRGAGCSFRGSEKRKRGPNGPEAYGLETSKPTV